MQKQSSLNLPWSTDWDALFGVKRPLIVEIGFGDAEYLIHLAQSHPDHHVVGLEISHRSMVKAEKKIAAQELTNACAVHSTAETALYHLLEPESVHTFHVNYPDPWFKKRHSGRQLMQRDTLDLMVSRLAPAGMFHLATDIIAYAEMSHALLIDTLGLENTLDKPWVNELSGRFTTKYEAKGIREGRPGNYFIYRRNHLAVPSQPVIKELPMPHMIIHTPQPPEEILAQFQHQSHYQNEIHIGVRNAYTTHDRRVLLFETSVREPTIDQQVALILAPYENEHEYILQLGSIGRPRPTVGLHQATALIGDWVVSLHPDAHIIEYKLKRL